MCSGSAFLCIWGLLIFGLRNRKEIMCCFNLLIYFILTPPNLPKGRLKIRDQTGSRALSPSLEGLGRSKCEGKK